MPLNLFFFLIYISKLYTNCTNHGGSSNPTHTDIIIFFFFEKKMRTKPSNFINFRSQTVTSVQKYVINQKKQKKKKKTKMSVLYCLFTLSRLHFHNNYANQSCTHANQILRFFCISLSITQILLSPLGASIYHRIAWIISSDLIQYL
jgi:hypothetical protein